MSDNLKLIYDKITTDIDPAGAPDSIKAEDHRDIEHSMVLSLGKYSGFVYKAIASGTPPDGSFSWENTPMNTLTDFTVKFNEFTSDGTRMLEVFNIMKKGDLIKFKDFLGRTALLIYQSSTGLVEGGEKIYNVVVKGIDSNPTYAYNGTDSFDCVFDFLMKGANNTSDLVNDGSNGSNVYITSDDLTGIVHEGYFETGTRSGGDLMVILGDYDNSNVGTTMVIDEDGQIFKFNGDINLQEAWNIQFERNGFISNFNQLALTASRTIHLPNRSGVVELINVIFTTEVNMDNLTDHGVYNFDVDNNLATDFVYTEGGGALTQMLSIDNTINFYGATLRVLNKHQDNVDLFDHITQEFVSGYSGKTWRRQYNGDESIWSEWFALTPEQHINYFENGNSRASGESKVIIGDYDQSGNGTRVQVEDEETQVVIYAVNGVNCTGSGSFVGVVSRDDITLTKTVPTFTRGDINIDLLTSDQVYALPDKSGTIALLSDVEHEGYSEVGTRDGAVTPLTVTLGDYDDSNGGTKIIINDDGGEIDFTGDLNFISGNSMSFHNSTFNTTFNTETLTDNRNIDLPNKSGVVALTSDVLKRVKISLTESQVKALGTTPITAILGQGSGNIVNIISVTTKVNFNTVAFNGTGSGIEIQDVGSADNQVTISRFVVNSATNAIIKNTIQENGSSGQLIDNANIELSWNGVAPTLGDGSLDIYITYEVITL